MDDENDDPAGAFLAELEAGPGPDFGGPDRDSGAGEGEGAPGAPGGGDAEEAPGSSRAEPVRAQGDTGGDLTYDKEQGRWVHPGLGEGVEGALVPLAEYRRLHSGFHRAGRFYEQREAARGELARLSALQEEQRPLLEFLRQQMAERDKALQEERAAREALPDPEADPEGYRTRLLEQIRQEQLEQQRVQLETQQQQEQRQRVEQEVARFTSAVQADERQYSAAVATADGVTPEAAQQEAASAKQHLFDEWSWELMHVGHPEAVARQMAGSRMVNFARTVASQGRNVNEALYAQALRQGYQPYSWFRPDGQDQPPAAPARRRPTPSPAMATSAQRHRAASSSAPAGRSAPPGSEFPSSEEIEAMTPEQWRALERERGFSFLMNPGRPIP